MHRVEEGEIFMRVDNKPAEVEDIRVQEPMIGISGTSYKDNITMARHIELKWPSVRFIEWGGDGCPSARMRVLKCVRPQQHKKFSTARDVPFHMLGHFVFGPHIVYYQPYLRPLAVKLQRAGIEPHPVDFQGRKYDEHFYLTLLAGLTTLTWLKVIMPPGDRLKLGMHDELEEQLAGNPRALVALRHTFDAALPLTAAKESIWNCDACDFEMEVIHAHHYMRATGKTNEASLIVHHLIDLHCSQDACKEHYLKTISSAWTTNKHIARGLINEKINGAGKAFMLGKQITGGAIKEYYRDYDAIAMVERSLKDSIRDSTDNDGDKDYLDKYKYDKIALLELFMEKLGSTWEEACRPRATNGFNGRRTGNTPWKHVEAVSEGKRHIGERKNRMSWKDHVEHHSSKHSKV